MSDTVTPVTTQRSDPQYTQGFNQALIDIKEINDKAYDASTRNYGYIEADAYQTIRQLLTHPDSNAQFPKENSANAFFEIALTLIRPFNLQQTPEESADFHFIEADFRDFLQANPTKKRELAGHMAVIYIINQLRKSIRQMDKIKHIIQDYANKLKQPVSVVRFHHAIAFMHYHMPFKDPELVNAWNSIDLNKVAEFVDQLIDLLQDRSPEFKDLRQFKGVSHSEFFGIAQKKLPAEQVIQELMAKIGGDCDFFLKDFGTHKLWKYVQTFIHPKPFISLLTNNQQAQQVLKINYIWQKLKNIINETPLVSTEDLQINDLVKMIKASEDPNTYGDIGITNDNVILLHRPSIYPHLTTTAIESILKLREKSPELWNRYGISVNLFSFLDNNIPQLGYSLTQPANILDKQVKGLKYTEEMNINNMKINLQKLLEVLEQLAHTHHIQTPHYFYIPENLETWKHLQAYGKKLFSRTQAVILKHLLKIDQQFLNDLEEKAQDNISNNKLYDKIYYDVIYGLASENPKIHNLSDWMKENLKGLPSQRVVQNLYQYLTTDNALQNYDKSTLLENIQTSVAQLIPKGDDLYFKGMIGSRKGKDLRVFGIYDSSYLNKLVSSLDKESFLDALEKATIKDISIHYLDPYHLLQLIKRALAFNKKSEMKSSNIWVYMDNDYGSALINTHKSTEDILQSIGLAQKQEVQLSKLIDQIFNFNPITPSDAERYKNILRVLIPRLEYALSIRTITVDERGKETQIEPDMPHLID